MAGSHGAHVCVMGIYTAARQLSSVPPPRSKILEAIDKTSVSISPRQIPDNSLLTQRNKRGREMYQGEGRALERKTNHRAGAAIPEVMTQLLPLSPAANTRGEADVQEKLDCALGQIRTADLRFRNSR